MRIDLNYGPPPLPEAKGNGAPNPGVTSASAGNLLDVEDQAQLSAAHSQVQAMVAQATQLPEIREERVQSLRQAVQGGHYQPNPEKVAGAMLVHMTAGPAA
jgi:flagellar biosynthesis anti-sigma factor FlgM